MPRPLKVFLCHAHSDKDSVKVLYARLKREGVDVWLDKEKLLPGADWEYEIRKAVRESDVVIVCLSKQFNQAGFRQKEVRIALEEADKKPEGEIFIIPARLEECDTLESLSKWHWVNLFESDGFRLLIRALRTRAEKIGATLLQREATTSRPKNDAEQQNAEKVRMESARREEEEQERQRHAKEQTDRDAVENAERERLAREYVKAERQKIELAQAKQVVGRVSNPTSTRNERASRAVSPTYEDVPAPVVEKKRDAPKLNVRILGIGAIVFACLLLAVFGGNYLFDQIDSPVSTTPAFASATKFVNVAPTEPSTPAPTKTFTPVPPTITPPPGIGSTMTSEKDGMVMVYVPAGEFIMGSDIGESDEQPVHTVNLDAFWIDRTEVTNAMYAKCVEDDDCSLPASSQSYTRDSYYGNSEFDDYPVIYVDWSEANKYCTWAGRELPTEAQWEKAARATNARTYPWGENISCDYANYYDGSKYCVGDTSKVGSYPNGASIYGAQDMAGNVWEWASSLYQNYPYNATDGREDLTADGSRVLRGGSWNNYFDSVHSAYRLGRPSHTYFNGGFRCTFLP